MESFLYNIKQFDNCFCDYPENPCDYRIISVECEARGNGTIASVFEVRGSSILLIQIFRCDNERFENTAKWLKGLYFSLGAKVIVLDTRGIGMGLADFMVRYQGEGFPSFGMIKDGLEPQWRRWYEETGLVENAIYTINPNLSLCEAFHIATRNLFDTKTIGIIKNEETLKLRDEIDNLILEDEYGTLIARKKDREMDISRFDTLERGIWWIQNFGYEEEGDEG